MNRIGVLVFYVFAGTAFGVVAWEGFTGVLQNSNPVALASAIINSVLVLGAAWWSYKKFGSDVKKCLHDMKTVAQTQEHHGKQITRAYGWLRNFGSRLEKLDGIRTDVRSGD